MIVFDWMQRIWSLARGSSHANSGKASVAGELQSVTSGLGFVPQRLRSIDLDPTFAEQADAGHMTRTAFARQCGLNAVFSWYVWFLEAGVKTMTVRSVMKNAITCVATTRISRRRGAVEFQGFLKRLISAWRIRRTGCVLLSTMNTGGNLAP